MIYWRNFESELVEIACDSRMYVGGIHDPTHYQNNPQVVYGGVLKCTAEVAPHNEMTRVNFPAGMLWLRGTAFSSSFE